MSKIPVLCTTLFQLVKIGAKNFGTDFWNIFQLINKNNFDALR